MKKREYHGATNTRLYYVWSVMRGRCRNPTDNRYEYYGARGITICSEWESFLAFELWAVTHGYKEGLTLDRKDNNGNYTPENCRWATVTEQQRNKRSNILLTAFGETKPMSVWAKDERCKVKYITLYQRIKTYYWPHEKAITCLVRRG